MRSLGLVVGSGVLFLGAGMAAGWVSSGGVFEVRSGAPGGGGGAVNDGLGTPVYVVDVSVGDGETGRVSDVVGEFQQKGNLIGQFYDGTNGLQLRSDRAWVLEGGTQVVDPYQEMDDLSLLPLSPVTAVAWSVAGGPIAVDGSGVVTGGTAAVNSLATVQGDWMGSTAQLGLTVYVAQDAKLAEMEEWGNLLGGGSFDTTDPGGLSAMGTVAGLSSPLLGATQVGDVLGLTTMFDGAGVTGGGEVQFGFTTLGSNYNEGIVVVLVDSAVPGGDTVKLQSLRSGAMLVFPVVDFSGAGTSEVALTLLRNGSGMWDYTLVVDDGGATILDVSGVFGAEDMVGDARIQFAYGAPGGAVSGVMGSFAGSDVVMGSGQQFALLQGTPGGGGGPVSDGLTTVVFAADVSEGDEMLGGVSDMVSGYQTKGNLIGQFYDVQGLLVTADPASVDEGMTRQLDASLGLDDESVLAVEQTEVAWSVVSGPMTGIDGNGLATAGNVYEDTLAVVRGEYDGWLDDADVMVLNVGNDDFGSYAGDVLDDGWQVGYFGTPPNADAAPGANPDQDRFNNLSEYLTGYDPTDDTDFLRLRFVNWARGVSTIELSKVVPGARYRVYVSSDAAGSDPWSEVTNFTTGVEVLDHQVEDPGSRGMENFYRVGVEAE